MGKQLSIRESNAKKIALRKMEEYFGYTSFQENQAAPITELFLEKDVFAVMPTASGKSICYQLPAIYFRKEKKKGITIVVEPVKALMDNQVRDLNKQMDHVAAAIHSGMPFNAYDNIKKHSETICLIYVAPERLANPDFHQLLEECFNWDVEMIVVDEAHTMSLWGHGFGRNTGVFRDSSIPSVKEPDIGQFLPPSRQLQQIILRMISEMNDMLYSGGNHHGAKHTIRDGKLLSVLQFHDVYYDLSPDAEYILIDENGKETKSTDDTIYKDFYAAFLDADVIEFNVVTK